VSCVQAPWCSRSVLSPAAATSAPPSSYTGHPAPLQSPPSLPPSIKLLYMRHAPSLLPLHSVAGHLPYLQGGNRSGEGKGLESGGGRGQLGVEGGAAVSQCAHGPPHSGCSQIILPSRRSTPRLTLRPHFFPPLLPCLAPPAPWRLLHPSPARCCPLPRWPAPSRRWGSS